MRLEGEVQEGVVDGPVPVGFRVVVPLAFACGGDEFLEVGAHGGWARVRRRVGEGMLSSCMAYWKRDGGGLRSSSK